MSTVHAAAVVSPFYSTNEIVCATKAALHRSLWETPVGESKKHEVRDVNFPFLIKITTDILGCQALPCSTDAAIQKRNGRTEKLPAALF